MLINRKQDVSFTNPLTTRFINDNHNNECDIFKKWKWDAIIDAIETGNLSESELITRGYIK